jgi:glycosyltransferase involved in cell wall biosynthesis
MGRAGKSKITICHIISSAEIAGGERYLYDLVKNSNKSIRHSIILPYRGPFAQVLKESGISFDIIKLQHRNFIKSILSIIRAIRIQEADIVHTHGYRANFYGGIVSFFKRVKHITTVHVSLLDYKDTPKLLRYLYIIFEIILSLKISKYVCVSRAMAEDMKKIGIPQKKISIIPNGVDLTRFYPRRSGNVIKDEIGLNSDTVLIGTVGRLVPEKGQIFLIEALRQLQGKFKNLKCVFFGEGPLFEYLRNKALTLGVLNMCIFAGTRKDIERVYSELCLFVLPSIREPFGLALLEAMACCIPVLATESGGPLEFINSGTNGVLVPPKNAQKLASEIERILLNRKRAKYYGREGRKYVERNFDVRSTIKKVENIYLSI